MNNSTVYHLKDLTRNSYWGRGILVGRTEDAVLAAYFIMGRSENSRNRVFLQEGENVRIEPHDPSKVTDPSLIIYYPVKKAAGQVIVTNGDQTDTVEAFLNEGKSFEEALRTRTFEPDPPHYTPRISCLIDPASGTYRMSILKDGDGEGGWTERCFYEYEGEAGIGHLIHTYEGNESPLPTFEGEPKKFRLPSTPEELMDAVWTNLDEDNKISLAVLKISKDGTVETTILNKRLGD